MSTFSALICKQFGLYCDHGSARGERYFVLRDQESIIIPGDSELAHKVVAFLMNNKELNKYRLSQQFDDALLCFMPGTTKSCLVRFNRTNAGLKIVVNNNSTERQFVAKCKEDYTVKKLK